MERKEWEVEWLYEEFAEDKLVILVIRESISGSGDGYFVNSSQR